MSAGSDCCGVLACPTPTGTLLVCSRLHPLLAPPYPTNLIPAGRWGYWTVWGYGSLCMGIFLVRTMKRIIFQEARHYSACAFGCTSRAGCHVCLSCRRTLCSATALAAVGGVRALVNHCLSPSLRTSPSPLPLLQPAAAANDLALTNYLLLALAAFQFPYSFWLGVRPPLPV